MTRVLLRLYLSHDRPFGPGKVQILESIRAGGLISEAARGMKMSYRSAWLLVNSMNSLFRKPVVHTTLGGRGGGSATLTEFGADVIRRYRSMERATRRAIAKDLAVLESETSDLRSRPHESRMNDHDRGAVDDVRMRGFAHRHTVEAALAWLDAQLRPLGTETVPLRMAAGRVLANPVVSDVDLPGFDRATMDGFAVVAESTEGAASYHRLPLVVIGDSLPGQPFHGSVGVGQAVRIMTGAPLPPGCDAVLPAEWVEHVAATSDTVSALAAVSPGKHVGRHGEDSVRGTTLFQPGRVLRPQDLGLLSSVGVGEVLACSRPLVRLVVTGNELLPSGSQPHGYRIADANGPMLAALVERDGGLVDFPGLVPDEHDAILNALQAAADVIIVSGGTSVGIEDLAPTLLARLGDLAIHGIAMRPSSPTGLGRIGHRLVFLLPGNPVSCLCAYDFFAGRAIRALGGRAKVWPYRPMRARLARKISSPIGRLDYARVQVVDGAVEPLAIGGASVLSSTTRADGFVIVPDDSEGIAPGTEVEVWLYA